MNHRRLMTVILGSSLVVVGGASVSGCGDEGQPARESISAPRKGGAVQAPGSEDTKGKPADGATVKHVGKPD
jgi:hypothetical protein